MTTNGTMRKIAVILDQVEQGWIASAPEARALAQGASRQEAVKNLVQLLNTYPDLLDEFRQGTAPTKRQVELLAV